MSEIHNTPSVPGFKDRPLCNEGVPEGSNNAALSLIGKDPKVEWLTGLPSPRRVEEPLKFTRRVSEEPFGSKKLQDNTIHVAGMTLFLHKAPQTPKL